MTNHGAYDPLLVLLSIAIAMFASYTALTLARSVSVSTGHARAAWLTGGSLAMGFGIWSMHFVGMLAFQMPGIQVSYDVPLLLLSVIVAILASAIALFVVARWEVTALALGTAGLMMGAAICGMHYIGIAGMHMSATVEWDYGLVVASILIALGAAYTALWLSFKFREENQPRGLRIFAASVMGLAISGMHYTAMAAMKMTPLDQPLRIREEDLLATGGLAVAVAGSTLMILTIALASSLAQRELQRQTHLAEEQRILFEDADRRATEQEALRRVTEELSSALTIDEVLRRITERAREATGADGAIAEKIGPSNNTVVIAASAGPGLEKNRQPYSYEGSLSKYAFSRGHQPPAAESDGVPESLLEQLEGIRPAEVLALPLTADDIHVGALILWRERHEPPFERDEVAMAIMLTRLASLAFRRALLLEETELRRRQLERAERLTGLGRVASSIAHEFNNVLMAIQTFHELIRRVGTFEQFETTATKIDQSIHRGKTVTDAVLRLTRAAQPDLAPLDLTLWLEGMRADLSALLPPGFEIAMHSEPALYVLADASHLEQALINLILNARDAMPEGGRIAITALAVSTEGQPQVELTIKDRGTGMDEETRKRIFEPLFTTRAGGTGLGLAIVHEIVRAHNGTITVETAPDSGTTFKITLPLAEAAHPSDPSSRESSAALSLLLVEDDDSVAEGMMMVLDLQGFQVERVSLGAQAVPALSRFRADAVVLDIGLPDMEGLEVYDLIQAARPGLPVVFATGHADESALAATLQVAHVQFLRKPFLVDALVAAIERAIRGSRKSASNHSR